MKCLLLALSVALVCGSPVMDIPQIMKGLDVQKVAGTWYSMVMAASNVALLNTESAPLRLHLKELRPTPEGNLEVIVHRWEDGRCAEKKIPAESTGHAGRFSINYLEENKVTVLDTDYKSYLFICMENTAAPEQSLTCQYLARTPKPSEEAMDRFSRAMKLLPIRIQLLFAPTPAQERCLV